MTGNELLRRLRRLGSQRGVAIRFEEERGKGSHGTSISAIDLLCSKTDAPKSGPVYSTQCCVN